MKGRTAEQPIANALKTHALRWARETFALWSGRKRTDHPSAGLMSWLLGAEACATLDKLADLIRPDELEMVPQNRFLPRTEEEAEVLVEFWAVFAKGLRDSDFVEGLEDDSQEAVLGMSEGTGRRAFFVGWFLAQIGPLGPAGQSTARSKVKTSVEIRTEANRTSGRASGAARRIGVPDWAKIRREFDKDNASREAQCDQRLSLAEFSIKKAAELRRLGQKPLKPSTIKKYLTLHALK